MRWGEPSRFFLLSLICSSCVLAPMYTGSHDRRRLRPSTQALALPHVSPLATSSYLHGRTSLAPAIRMRRRARPHRRQPRALFHGPRLLAHQQPLHALYLHAPPSSPAGSRVRSSVSACAWQPRGACARPPAAAALTRAAELARRVWSACAGRPPPQRSPARPSSQAGRCVQASPR